MGTVVGRFLADETGVTAVEYGLIALFVSLVLVAAAGVAGQHLRQFFHLAATVVVKGPPKVH
jgi:pilus assembly protein Flp/PilA